MGKVFELYAVNSQYFAREIKFYSLLVTLTLTESQEIDEGSSASFNVIVNGNLSHDIFVTVFIENFMPGEPTGELEHFDSL